MASSRTLALKFCDDGVMQFWDRIKEFLDVAAVVISQSLKTPQGFGELNFPRLQMEGGGVGRTYSDAVAVAGLFCRAHQCRLFLIYFHLKTETKSCFETYDIVQNSSHICSNTDLMTETGPLLETLACFSERTLLVAPEDSIDA